MEIMTKEDFTFDQKILIWLHYVATISFLKHDLLEVDITIHTEKHFGKNFKKLIKYPVLIPEKLFINNSFNNLKPRGFDDFCDETDSRVSSGLLGYYWRFKKEIFKKHETTKLTSR